MKQIMIGGNKALYTNVDGFADVTNVPAGQFGLYDLTTNKALTAENLHNFEIILGRGDGVAPIVFPEVDLNTLSIVTSEYKAAVNKTSTFTIPTPVAGVTYTVIVVKLGTKFNEKNKWTASYTAKTGDDGSAVCAKLKEQVLAFGLDGVSFGSGATDSFILVSSKDVYTIVLADGLTGVNVSENNYTPAILDKAYVKDLASRCAAGKGFDYTGDSELYPGYPEVLEANQYDMFTLHFATKRASAHQVDEPVYQTLHLVVPHGAACVAELETLFAKYFKKDNTPG